MESIVSYPDRGPYGDPLWRGNTSGRLIRDLLMFFRPALFCDPMMGSGTSADVARELGIRFAGMDLHSGFDILRDSISQWIGESPDYVLLHPPYHDLIQYSGAVWGTQPHPSDLSRCASPEEFIEKLQRALYNVYSSLSGKGHYSVLIGDIRKNNVFWSIQADIIKAAPGSLESVIIKQQHNCQSDSRSYRGSFIPIRHEYVLSFRKSSVVFGVLDAAVATSRNLSSLSNATWKAIIEWTLHNLGGQATLKDIYRHISAGAHERTIANPHWQAKVRQVLQKYARNIDRGVWALNEPSENPAGAIAFAG